MSDGQPESELDVPLGIRAITDVFVDRGGINYDDLLLARTCHRCGRLIFDAEATDIRGRDGYKVIVRTPDAHAFVLQGSELLTARCCCGCFCSIIVYGPALNGQAGYAAYTMVELNGLSAALAGRLRQMRALGDSPPDVDAWIARETTRGVGRAVSRTARQAFATVREDWSEAHYSSGWITV